MTKEQSNSLERARTSLGELSATLSDLNLLGREEVLNHLLTLGKGIPTTPEHPDPNQLVGGCQSQVYLFVQKEGDRLFFRGASDSLMLKGFLAILFTTLNGLTCSDIGLLWTDLETFLRESGVPESLTPNRAMGLSYILAFTHSLQERVC